MGGGKILDLSHLGRGLADKDVMDKDLIKQFTSAGKIWEFCGNRSNRCTVGSNAHSESNFRLCKSRESGTVPTAIDSILFNMDDVLGNLSQQPYLFGLVASQSSSFDRQLRANLSRGS